MFQPRSILMISTPRAAAARASSRVWMYASVARPLSRARASISSSRANPHPACSRNCRYAPSISAAVGKLATPSKPASATRAMSSARSSRGSKQQAPKKTGTVARGRISVVAKLMTKSLLSRIGSIVAIEGSPMFRIRPALSASRKSAPPLIGRLGGHPRSNRRTHEKGRRLQPALRSRVGACQTPSSVPVPLGTEKARVNRTIGCTPERQWSVPSASFRSRRRSGPMRANWLRHVSPSWGRHQASWRISRSASCSAISAG